MQLLECEICKDPWHDRPSMSDSWVDVGYNFSYQTKRKKKIFLHVGGTHMTFIHLILKLVSAGLKQQLKNKNKTNKKTFIWNTPGDSLTLDKIRSGLYKV